jgi:hypothetical protein
VVKTQPSIFPVAPFDVVALDLFAHRRADRAENALDNHRRLYAIPFEQILAQDTLQQMATYNRAVSAWLRLNVELLDRISSSCHV